MCVCFLHLYKYSNIIYFLHLHRSMRIFCPWPNDPSRHALPYPVTPSCGAPRGISWPLLRRRTCARDVGPSGRVAVDGRRPCEFRALRFATFFREAN